VRAGGSVNVNLSVDANGTLSAPVSFACSGLPAGGQCAFNPSSVAANALPATVALTITTSGGQIGALGGAANVLAVYTAVGLMLPALLLAPLGRRRRKSRRAVLTALMLLLLMGALAGCSGTLLPNPAPATGSFNVVVTATSGSTQSSTTITLTVTP
jgi:cytochrome bd-type quinol oxidase subunit 2